MGDRIVVAPNHHADGGGFAAWVEGIPAAGTGATAAEAIRSLCAVLADFVDARTARIAELESVVPR